MADYKSSPINSTPLQVKLRGGGLAKNNLFAFKEGIKHLSLGFSAALIQLR